MKKLFLLISLWCCYSMLSGSFAQTVFLEDFNEGSTFPEGWELKAIPEDENVVDYSLVGSSWCLDEGREFRPFYNAKMKRTGLPTPRMELISPQLDLSDFDQLNFSMDFYRLEFDLLAGEWRMYLYVKNNQMDDWVKIYTHDYTMGWMEFKRSFPFICSLDSSIFRREGFQFMFVLDENIGPLSNGNHWFNIDNIKIEVPQQIDLALFDRYPDQHIANDSLFVPKARIINKGIDLAGGKVHCAIREHLSNELVYEETIDIQEMARMDTLSLDFPGFYLPYTNHLFHLNFDLECEGDIVLDNNNVSFDIDTYSTPFHNWIGLNLFYSTEYSLGIFDERCYRQLLRNLDTLNQIKQLLPKASIVNYVYDDVPDSLSCQTTVSFMTDLGIAYAPSVLIPMTEEAYIPRFSLYPRRVFRSFEYAWEFIDLELYNYFKQIADYRSPFTLDVYGTHSGLDYSVMVELTPKAPFINDRLKLRTVITRSHVPSNANPDIYEDYRVEYFDDVVQMALPDTNGIAFAMDGSETSSKQWEMSFSLKDFWDPEQVKIVTYVQDTFTYDIIQCKAVNLLDLWGVGVGESAQSPAESILITPNPAKDVLYAQLELEMPANILFRLHDINGRDLGILKETFLGAGKHNVSIQLPESIKSGIYILQTETGRQSYSQKLNVLR